MRGPFSHQRKLHCSAPCSCVDTRSSTDVLAPGRLLPCTQAGPSSRVTYLPYLPLAAAAASIPHRLNLDSPRSSSHLCNVPSHIVTPHPYISLTTGWAICSMASLVNQIGLEATRSLRCARQEMIAPPPPFRTGSRRECLPFPSGPSAKEVRSWDGLMQGGLGERARSGDDTRRGPSSSRRGMATIEGLIRTDIHTLWCHEGLMLRTVCV